MAAATATTTTTTTKAAALASKLLGSLFYNRSQLPTPDSASGSSSGTYSPAAVASKTTPASYLQLYDDVANALQETEAEAAEVEAEPDPNADASSSYALIDDISDWLLGIGSDNSSSSMVDDLDESHLWPSATATVAVSNSSGSSSGSHNETLLSGLAWLTLDADSVNGTLAHVAGVGSSGSSSSSNNNSSGSSNSGNGLYALRNFVEQQLSGESSNDADIALIDSAEESALDNADTDYGLLGFNGGSFEATNELLQRTAAAATGSENRTGSSYDSDAVWLPGTAAGAARSGGTVGSNAGSTGGSGSSFMLLLENFNDYFPNYNGSTVSGTTVTSTTASNILEQSGSTANITSLYIENYRMNCTNATVNLTTESCHELKVVDHNYWALILILFPILTLFGNILVILSVCRERSLQTVTNYFIVSLAIADLLVAVVVMPFAVYILHAAQYSLKHLHILDKYINKIYN